jgi:excisionase family DNA binding protein
VVAVGVAVGVVGGETMNEKRNDYTVPQVAKEFSCSSGTVKNWIKAGRIKAYRLGGETGRDYRIPWAEVDRIRNEWKVSLDTSQAL